MDFNKCFERKVILITGSSSGIGEATAELFSSFGSHVVVTGRDKDKVKTVAEKCRNIPPKKAKVLEIIADITKEDDAKFLIDTTIQEFGKIDVLVNNAGISKITKIENPLNDYDRIYNTNVHSVVRLTHYAVPYLEKTKGTIINIGSRASKRAFRTFYAYCMSKAAIDMFTQCLAIDLGPKGIRVNSVNPAVTMTPIFVNSLGFKETEVQKLKDECIRDYPLQRAGEPNDIANAIAFLASDNASFISGEILGVNGGSMFTGHGAIEAVGHSVK